MRTLSILVSLVVLWLSPVNAIQNDRFTALWDAPSERDRVDRYEFRWRHFASPDWIPLPDQPGTATSFTITFLPLPNTPPTDRWMCLDARSRVGDAVSAWLSETTDGASCAGVDVGAIVITPPPPVIPPPVVPPPTPPPPVEVQIFSNVTNDNGVLSLQYKSTDCKRGVQKTTSTVKNGLRTITFTCMR